ncbi:MAG: HAD-IIB family hydrolase [Ruminococcaceae bacterium]|nr:HAD-IIB family hydrolase [Oscillospiraceae bacterium]
MFSQVLLTVDYDRTLTGPDSTIPERNLEAIRYFMENGGAFTMNTGRSTTTMRNLFDKIPVNAPFLLYNGSAAYENGKLTHCCPIDLPMWDTLDEVHAHFPDMNLEIQGEKLHYLYKVLPGYPKFYQGIGWGYATVSRGDDLGPFLKFSLFGRTWDDSVAQFYEGTQEDLDRMDQAEAWLKARFGDKVSVFRAAPRIIDIHAGGVSKGVAARALQKRMGRKILVCVGDSHNDLSMLDDADYAYTPADAVIAGGYETVCNCADGAVADVIYKKIPEILKNQP